MQKGIEVLNSVIVNIPIVGASRYRFNPGFSTYGRGTSVKLFLKRVDKAKTRHFFLYLRQILQISITYI